MFDHAARGSFKWIASGLFLFLTMTVFKSRGLPTAVNPPYDVGRVDKPRLFAENVVSTEDDESNGTFSPDGEHYYFAKVSQYTSFPRLAVLCVSHYANGAWSQPEILPFSGNSLDLAPRLSLDGNTLYFSSSRPINGRSPHALKLWAAQHSSSGWLEPTPVPSPLNKDDSNWNWAPSFTKDGTVYFASTRDGSGHPHIFRSRQVNGTYQEPEKLGAEINSDFSETDPYVSPDEHLLFFASSGNGLPTAADRQTTLKGGGALYARGDLYVSAGQGGHWQQALHLEHGVNTFADESSPSITPNGKYLFFTSERSPFTIPTAHRLNSAEIEKLLHSVLNGHGNIFFVSIEALGLGENEGAR